MGIMKELRIGTSEKFNFNGGLCLAEENGIALNQSPKLLNVCLDDGGNPSKRPGQKYIYETSLGEGGINAIYGDYKGYLIVAHGTKLYRQRNNAQPEEIYDELEDKKAFIFAYNSILYLMNGSQYIQYDGETVKEVEPYIPLLVMNKKPDASTNDVNESWNMLGRGFRESFNGDGTSKTFKLSLDNLDADKVACNVGGVEGSGFTVDRANGTVTFDTAPEVGNNNVEITAYKTMPELAENIKGCTIGVEFSNRMFITGNSELKNYYYASGLTDDMDVSYFPQKYSYRLSGGDKAITGLKVHHNKLVVFKEDMTATVEASTGLDNTASFPVKLLNTDVGCDIPGSIQLVNNSIVFANTRTGVNVIVSTIVEGEKSIIPISHNINGDNDRPGLLQEGDDLLKTATSIDFGQKYYLCVNGKAYVWDYKDVNSIANPDKLRWFLYDNIYSNGFTISNNKITYGHSTKGMVCQFTHELNDFGEPIKAVFRTKLFDFGYPDVLKNVKKLWYTCKPNSGTNVILSCYNDKGSGVEKTKFPMDKMKNFKWSEFSWEGFSWSVQTFAPTIRIKTKNKKIRYFQVEVVNETAGENLSILHLAIEYMLLRKVK